MNKFKTINVVGTKFRKPEEQAKLADMELAINNAATFRREPENKFDANAIAVYVDGVHAGYVPASMCVEFGEFLTANPDTTAMAAIVVRNGLPMVSVTLDL